MARCPCGPAGCRSLYWTITASRARLLRRYTGFVPVSQREAQSSVASFAPLRPTGFHSIRLAAPECSRAVRMSGSLAAKEGASAAHEAGQHIIVMDAMPWLYRSHFGFGSNRLRNQAGVDTTVIYGYFSFLLKLLELVPDVTHAAIVFDSPGMTFRHEMYPEYKGTRTPMPMEVREALPVIRETLQAMGFKIFMEPGLEADDVVGAIAKSSSQQGALVTIASSDKDFQQLLGPLVRMAKPAKKVLGEKGGQVTLYSAADFANEYQDEITPEQFADVLGLAGDASDNVPGVKGVGMKTAVQLVSMYGSVENVIAHAGEIKRKNVRETLATEAGIETARLSRQLVEIRTNLVTPGLALALDDLKVPTPEALLDGALEPWQRLEFNSLIHRLEERAASYASR